MTQTPQFPQYQAAQELEMFLGNPEDTRNTVNYARAVELDERDEAPSEACRLLDDWGLNLYYVPETEGGRMQSLEQALALGRVVSRRDLSVMIEHAITFLGYVFVSLAGSPEAKRAALSVIERRGRIALGLTERERGGDLSNCECKAESHEGRYLISGEKWLINNATRGEAITCLARTDARGGPRGFSLFLLDKKQLPPGSFVTLPRVRTHGIRGVDISAIRFQSAPVSSEALVGKPGMGLEIVLKGLQLTRTMCANLSLGAADTALRLTADFALNRSIYGTTVWGIPAARGTLKDAFLDLLICDCVSTSAARAPHVVPEQMSVVSAAVKYFVPVTLERAVQSLTAVLGARYYLREDHWHGMFQKILRDIGIVALFDGSTAVNLNVISSQLLSLCMQQPQPATDVRSRLNRIFDITVPLQPFDSSRLNLFNNGKHDIVQVIPQLGDFLESAAGTSSATLDSIRSHVADMKAEYEFLRQTVALNPAAARHSHGQTAEMFEYARRYCIFHAAASCVLFWTENRRAIGGFFAEGEWLRAALSRLLSVLCPTWQIVPSPEPDAICDELKRRLETGMMFSAVPFSLAGRQGGTIRQDVASLGALS
jgi:alkylation response protein AidB-like acyl-CoA dehydrogenase